jgi:3-oxoacyl-[acyl-carrier-protein] synthase II
MKIAITGLGVISCCGNTVDEFWHSVTNGVSGLGKLTRVQNSNIKTNLVGEVKNFSLGDKFDYKIRTKTDLHIQYALAAADQAVTQSNLIIDNPHRIHTVIGTCSGSYDYIKNSLKLLNNNHSVAPSFLTGSLNNMIAGYINTHFGFMGSGLVLNGACASGAQAIALGAMLIETGQADAVIVGGAENWISELPISGLESLRALTHDPVGCRPFDIDRSGFSLSEGAAVLVLENESYAKSRKADILCYLSGYGLSSDANHPTAPRADGLATRYMINSALSKANIHSQDINYINAHATGTSLGDHVESETLYSIFQNVPYLSATKAVTGHAIGAVGAMEAIVAIKAIVEQTVPLTTNLITPDCPGNHVIKNSIDTVVNHVLSNNFGFGGTNSALVFSKS